MSDGFPGFRLRLYLGYDAEDSFATTPIGSEAQPGITLQDILDDFT